MPPSTQLAVALVLESAERLAAELRQRAERALNEFPHGDPVEEDWRDHWRRRDPAAPWRLALTEAELSLIDAVALLPKDVADR